MTLFASAHTHGNVKSGPIGDIGIAKCCGMFTAGTMAVFACDICDILKILGHRRKVGAHQCGWEGPMILLGNSIKPTVQKRAGIGVVSGSVALDAGLTITGAIETINAACEHAGVLRS